MIVGSGGLKDDWKESEAPARRLNHPDLIQQPRELQEKIFALDNTEDRPLPSARCFITAERTRRNES